MGTKKYHFLSPTAYKAGESKENMEIQNQIKTNPEEKLKQLGLQKLIIILKQALEEYLKENGKPDKNPE